LLRSAALASNQKVLTVFDAERGEVVAGVEQIIALLTKEKLTVNHVRDSASSRGIAVHDALEMWVSSGEIPDPEFFPAEQAGYVRGLVEFLKVAEPTPIASEVMVGSVKHGYAGRYDI